MKEGQGGKKGSTAFWLIIGFVAVFLIATGASNWDAIKAGYDKGKSEKESVEEANPEEERVHPDALIIENMQISKHRIEQKFNATMLNGESNIEQLQLVLDDLLSFRTELLEFKKLASNPNTFDLIDEMINDTLGKQKQVSEAMTQMESIQEEGTNE